MGCVSEVMQSGSGQQVIEPPTAMPHAVEPHRAPRLSLMLNGTLGEYVGVGRRHGNRLAPDNERSAGTHDAEKSLTHDQVTGSADLRVHRPADLTSRPAHAQRSHSLACSGRIHGSGRRMSAIGSTLAP